MSGVVSYIYGQRKKDTPGLSVLKKTFFSNSHNVGHKMSGVVSYIMDKGKKGARL